MIDCLKDIKARHPDLVHTMLGSPFGEIVSQFKERLTRFAEEVIPAFEHPGVRAGV